METRVRKGQVLFPWKQKGKERGNTPVVMETQRGKGREAGLPYLAIVDYLWVAPEQSWQQSPGRNVVGDMLPRP